MTGVVKLSGATQSYSFQWKSIKWNKVQAVETQNFASVLNRLQMRIAKAVREGKDNKRKSLQWILSHSFKSWNTARRNNFADISKFNIRWAGADNKEIMQNKKKSKLRKICR